MNSIGHVSLVMALAEAAGLAARAESGQQVSHTAALAFLARWQSLPPQQFAALRRFLESKSLIPRAPTTGEGSYVVAGEEASEFAETKPAFADEHVERRADEVLRHLAHSLTREAVSDLFCELFSWTYAGEPLAVTFEASPLVERLVREASVVARWGDLNAVRVALTDSRVEREEMRRLAVWLDRGRGGSIFLFVSQSLAAIGLAVIALGAEDESAPARSVPVWDLRDSDERLHAAISLVGRFPVVKARRRVAEDEQEESLPEARRRSVQLARDKQTASRQRTPPIDIEQVFLRDMRSIPMLKREEEVRLARSIAEKRRELVELVFLSKPARQHLLTLRNSLGPSVQAAGADDDQLADEGGSEDEAGAPVASADLDADSMVVGGLEDGAFGNPDRAQELLNAACALVATGQCEADAPDGGVGGRLALSRTLNEMPLEVAHAKRAFFEFKRRRAQFVDREFPNQEVMVQSTGPLVDAESELGMTLAEADSHEKRVAVVASEIEALCGRFLSANLRLVAHSARRYAHRHRHVATQLLDLVQGGTFGLMRAVERFDPERGYKFSTYATWWIRQSITRTLANDGRTIRIPVHLKEQMNRIRRAYRALESGEDGAARAIDVASYLSIPLAKVERFRTLGLSNLSLDRPDAFGEPLVERVPSQSLDPEQRMLGADLSNRVRTALSRLEARKQIVLRRRYGVGVRYPETLEEIAADFGVTRERIRQIESDAEADLQRMLTERFALEHGLRVHPTENAVARQQKRRQSASRAASGQLPL